MSASEPGDIGGGGGGGGSGDTDGSGSGGSSGGGGFGIFPSFDQLAPGFLTNNIDILRAFLQNPRNFIFGVVAFSILEFVFGILTAAVNLIIRVFLGSAPQDFNAPGETLGLADVPFAVVEPLLAAGGGVGATLTGAIDSLNEPIFVLAGSAGPLSPVIIVGAVVLEGIAIVWLLQKLVFVALDLLQLGGLTES